MIPAIILAAGMSSRLGTAKQLLQYQGRPLIRHVAETVLKSNVKQAIVVTGACGRDVAAALAGLPVTMVYNPEYAAGQSTSLVCGLNKIGSPLPDGVLFALGDQPLVKVDTINRLLAEFAIHRGIVVPWYRGRRGNPVIFSKSYFPMLKQLSGDQGARQLILCHSDDVRRVEVDDPGVVFDVDTRKDAEALAKEQEP